MAINLYSVTDQTMNKANCTGRIFIAEDNPANQLLIELLLQKTGCDDYIPKPFDTEKLMQIFDKYLSGKTESTMS